jgi:hypothetical protein
MNIFNSAVRYIQRFDPLFAPIGVSDREIQTLEALAGRSMPFTYVMFLERMGGSTDWLSMDGCDLKYATVLEFYRSNSWLSQSQYVRIGTSLRFPALHPHLEDLVLAEDFPPVITIPDYTQASFQKALQGRTYRAGSLLEWVCMPAFELYQLNAGSRKPTSLTASEVIPNGLERVQSFFERMNFDVLFFSSPTTLVMDTEGFAMRATQTPYRPLTVTISGDSPLQQDGYLQLIWQSLGLMIPNPT